MLHKLKNLILSRRRHVLARSCGRRLRTVSILLRVRADTSSSMASMDVVAIGRLVETGETEVNGQADLKSFEFCGERT